MTSQWRGGPTGCAPKPEWLDLPPAEIEALLTVLAYETAWIVPGEPDSLGEAERFLWDEPTAVQSTMPLWMVRDLVSMAAS